MKNHVMFFMYGELSITQLFWHLAIFRTVFCCWLMNIFLKHFWTEKLLIHKPQHRPIHSGFIRLENLRGLSYTLPKLGPFRPLKYFKAPSITKAHKIYARLLAHLSKILFYFWTSYWYWKQIAKSNKLLLLHLKGGWHFLRKSLYLKSLPYISIIYRWKIPKNFQTF